MPELCVHEFSMAASPEHVFSALTEQDELVRWLTRDATAEPTVGSVAEFRFRDGAVVMELEIARLEREKCVEWRVRHAGPAELNGTSITWDLAPVTTGTSLRLSHHATPRAEASQEQPPDAWAFYAGSLQSYLETGQGTPNGLFG